MKTLFVYFDVNSSTDAQYACGIGSLSAYIKKFGHDSELCFFKSFDDFSILSEKIESYCPDLIGISCTTSGYSNLDRLTEHIKKKAPNVLLILGGSHISISPENIETAEHIDGICIGYGEKPMLDLLNALEQKKPYESIPGFWFKKGKDIIKNEKRDFTDNWNEFFDFDREIFFDELNRLNPNAYKFGNGLLGDKVFEYIFCRACPFACSFCAAPLIKTWGKGKGWIRLPDPSFAVSKLKSDSEQYKLTGFAFHDDIFTFNKKWFLEWAELYKKELNLPYVCNLRVGTFDDEIIDALVATNCTMAIVGIESGNEKVRNEIANRRMTNKKITSSLLKLKKAGINVYTNNMIGFPGETFEQFMDTLNINAIIAPNNANLSVFYPYPGTELYNKCVEEKIINLSETVVERHKSILSLYGFPKKKIERIAESFYALVRYQRLVIKWFGAESIFSIKYTEPVMSPILKVLLRVYRIFRNGKSEFWKVKQKRKHPLAI
jgi:anaerobic magnesium-protoporphyrin IX monomethyl ester cyclase